MAPSRFTHYRTAHCSKGQHSFFIQRHGTPPSRQKIDADTNRYAPIDQSEKDKARQKSTTTVKTRQSKNKHNIA
jgi:hypothetical protein